MDNDRIKSAFELAMEKISEIPDATPEEIEKGREQEYQPLGAALAHRYLTITIKDEEVEATLHKFTGDEANIVRKAYILTLLDAIQLDGINRIERIFNGIQIISKGLHHQRIIDEYKSMFHEFSNLREKHYAKYRIQLVELLQGIGISGSAVDPNIKNSEGWQVELARVKAPYEIRLIKFRENLYKQIISSH